ncbi:MAG TPA: hypothetical protein VET88_08835 [Gammaproteobacteria bacterium]|nr:hypothetical protein [Gammaproteobacteria bacterium]
MKTSTLLQSCLLTAGLLLGSASAVQAGSPYSHSLRGGDFHTSAHNHRCCSRHKTSWHAGHRHDRGHHYGHYGKPKGIHHKGHHDSRDRWSRHRDRSDRRYGKIDGRHGGGRHG